MTMTSFIENLSRNTTQFIAQKDGLSYLNWAASLSLSGNPEHSPALFDGKPHLPALGGVLVGVDMLDQRTWLPVLDGRNKPIPVEWVTSRDISDAIQRCRAKAIAMTTGVGLSLYAGYGGDGEKFLEELGVTPESDLSKTHPITSKKGGENGVEYLDWAVAVAAAKITDGSFRWEVVMHRYVDPETGEVSTMPFLKTFDTYMVSVEVTYKGRKHMEFLPIMGVLPVKTRYGERKMDHQPLTAPNVFDWNRSVMRCLAKAISVVTGYGISLYAKEDMLKPEEQPEPASEQALAEVREMLQQAGKEEAAMCSWLGITSLEEANQEAIDKAKAVLAKALSKASPKKASTEEAKQAA